MNEWDQLWERIDRPLNLGETVRDFDICWGIDTATYLPCRGDYVRNKAGTVTGEIVAIDAGQAWVSQGKHHVTVNLSDLEPAPKPLQVGELVKDPDGYVAPGEIVAIHENEACIKYGDPVGLVVERLADLVRA